EAYDKVQAVAFVTRRDNRTFRDALLNDDGIRSILSMDQINNIFDFKYYLKNVDRIFAQVGI
ncbi:MAG: adenylosuccinate lyase, partial [Candidatus Omnitrophota bacterium]